jgi:hypothetical protein
MKKILGSIALGALALGLSIQPASAQMHGFINYPAIGGVGLKISGDYGRGLNDESSKSNYFGGRAELGVPFFNVWAGIGSFKAGDEFVVGENSSEISYGGGAALNLLKGPLVPVRVSLQAGAGYLSEEGGSQLTVPFGLAAAINVPTPGVGIVPWAYAFAEYHSISPDVGSSVNKIGFGISGGLEVNLPMGLGFYAALDWSTVDYGDGPDTGITPLFLAAGATYKISVPSLGM